MEGVSLNLKGKKAAFHGFRKAFIQNSEISALARFVLVLLITFKGKNEVCWPSVGTLAKHLGLNKDTTCKYINELVRKGFLIKRSRGIGRSLLYAPSYWKISSGSNYINGQEARLTEKTLHQPTETTLNRSIDSGNKDTESLKGKELFNKRRKELGL